MIFLYILGIVVKVVICIFPEFLIERFNLGFSSISTIFETSDVLAAI